MRKITKRSAAVVAGSVLALTGATAAFAYASGWFSGSGTAYAHGSTIQTVTAVIDSRSVGNIYPGKELAVSGTVTNPNDYTVKINSIAVGSVSTGNSACDAASGLSFTEFPSNLLVAHGSFDAVPLGKLTMNQYADPSCSGATFTITATMTGEISS
jgi:hypothetical protein